MARLLPHPEIDWKDDGTPVARAMGDVYFTAGDGLAETRAVFLTGCGLPEAWAGRQQFTIAETGFGTGLNFLALWQMWRAHRPSPQAQLHFVSFEGFPLRREDAARALSAWPELKELSDRLLARWPGPVRGVRQIHLPEEGVSLTLHLGDIAEMLPDSRFQADAWFLDGFSPAKNEAMWAEEMFPLIAARSAPGARLATFTVAGAVRRGLAAAGFTVEKAAGHGRKRERLEARLVTSREAGPDTYGLRPTSNGRKVAIVGAGIAGAGAAQALVRAGAEVTVFERLDAPAMATSGNPMGLVMPRLDATDTVQARLMIDAYLAAREAYAGLPGVSETEVRQSPRKPEEVARFEKVLADPPLPLEDLEAIRGGGLLHKRALVFRPRLLIPALLEGAQVRTGVPAEINTTTRTVNGEAFDAIVFANAMAVMAHVPWLGLVGRLGQVEHVTGAPDVPTSAIAGGHYAIASGTDRLWGATFEPAPNDGGAPVTPAAREANAEALLALDPYWRQEALGRPATSRAGIRPTTADRLPLIGGVPDMHAALEVFEGIEKGRPADADAPLLAGIYMVNGFGARGFTWAPWAGRILASHLQLGPAPAPVSALQSVSPMRLILRGLRKGTFRRI